MKLQSIALLVLIVLALFAPVSVWAQGPDATQEAPEVVTVEVSEDEPVTIESPAAPIVVETQSDITWVLVLVGGIVGVILGGGGVGVWLSRANSNPEIKDSTEAILGNSVPASALDKANDLSVAMLAQLDTVTKALRDVLEFTRDVTDGKPNTGAQG